MTKFYPAVALPHGNKIRLHKNNIVLSNQYCNIAGVGIVCKATGTRDKEQGQGAFVEANKMKSDHLIITGIESLYKKQSYLQKQLK